jgi:hypothetical protein
MAVIAARRASATPLQSRLSPACNSDCARIWAPAGVKVQVPSKRLPVPHAAHAFSVLAELNAALES